MDEQAKGRQRVSGEVVPFGKLFAALTTLKRKDRVTEFDVQVYEDRTAHVPLSILSRAVTKWIDTQQWFPTVAELLEACEKVRVEMRSRIQFQPCAECELTPGWVWLKHENVERLARCTCWLSHLSKVAALGVGPEPLALPPVQEERDRYGS